jgi:hypothetical protein
MAAEITDDHLAAFCTEANWDGLADALKKKYATTTERLVLYNAGNETPERFEKYGTVARLVSAATR